MKSIKIGKTEITERSCRCFETKIFDKTFGYFLKPAFPKDTDDNILMVTGVEILKTVNTAGVSLQFYVNNGVWTLQIETTTHTLYIKEQ